MSSQRDANQAMDDTDGWNEGLKEDIKYKKFISTNLINISSYIRVITGALTSRCRICLIFGLWFSLDELNGLVKSLG